VTQKSVREYVEAIRRRYGKGSKEEKGLILDEFTKTTGTHRKAAIRLLNRPLCRGATVKRGGAPPEIRRTGHRGAEVCLGGIRSFVLEAAAALYPGTYTSHGERWRKTNGR